MPSFSDRLSHAWNAFMDRDSDDSLLFKDLGPATSVRPDIPRTTRSNERSIINAVYNRISTDCAAIEVKHIRLDKNGRYISTIDSGLNNCLTFEANIDQTGRAFVQDIVMTMLDTGCAVVVPIDTTIDPEKYSSYEINTMRVGRVVNFHPQYIDIEIYNERSGHREQLSVPKSMAAIIENPFYATMNSPSSTMQRLIRKLNILDAIDEQSGSGKLDLIIQLPYVIKSEKRKEQAEERRKMIEDQLASSKYGIAYTDGTEHITQLNRAVENNLMKQIEYLTTELYSQLGLTLEILNGTATDEAMLNYYNRTIEPIMSAIVDEMKRKFLTKTARTQKQSIKFFRDPFKLVPVSQIAEIADKFTRNEILSSNEVRQIVGLMPVNDPKADELRNKNLNGSKGQKFANTNEEVDTDKDTVDEKDSEMDANKNSLTKSIAKNSKKLK